MSDAVIITMSCSSCGANLEITTDIEQFVCLHCGMQQIVRRGGGIVSLQPAIQGIARGQNGTGESAAGLAIRQLSEEIRKETIQLRQLEEKPLYAILPPSTRELVWPLLAAGMAVLLFLGFVLISKAGMGAVILLFLWLLIFFLFMDIRGTRLDRARAIKAAAIETRVYRIEKLQQAFDQKGSSICSNPDID